MYRTGLGHRGAPVQAQDTPHTCTWSAQHRLHTGTVIHFAPVKRAALIGQIRVEHLYCRTREVLNIAISFIFSVVLKLPPA